MLLYTSVYYLIDKCLLSHWLDSLTTEDIEKLDIIKKEVLLEETTLERRKARVNQYVQWVSEIGRR